MSVKTVAIDDSVHLLLSKKQIELREKGIDKKFSDIANIAFKYGIDNVEEQFRKELKIHSKGDI